MLPIKIDLGNDGYRIIALNLSECLLALPKFPRASTAELDRIRALRTLFHSCRRRISNYPKLNVNTSLKTVSISIRSTVDLVLLSVDINLSSQTLANSAKSFRSRC